MQALKKMCIRVEKSKRNRKNKFGPSGGGRKSNERGLKSKLHKIVYGLRNDQITTLQNT